MGQETASFISDLNSAWPLSTDKIRFGAVHLRTIKASLKATFPNVTGAVTLSHTQINDAVRKSVRNVLAGTVSGAEAALQFESNSPGYLFKDLDASADAKIWRDFLTTGDTRRSDVLDDAGTNAVIWRQIVRAGTTISEIRHTATLFSMYAKAYLDGVLELQHASDTTIARASAGLVSVEGEVLGFRRPVPIDITGNYNIGLSDAGKGITYTGSGGHDVTIPSNASQPFAQHTGIIITNNSASPLEVNINTDSLIYMGSSTTGPFNIAPNGVLVIYKVATTKWLCAGVGISS